MTQNPDQIRFRSTDLDEAVAAVSRVYCPHQVTIKGSNRGVETSLDAIERPTYSMVRLKYSAPVHIDAGTFDNLLLFMTCSGGAAS